MKVYPLPTKFHQYAFEFKYKPDMVDFCNYVSKSVGPVKFSYYDGKWHFTDMKVLEYILGRYSETEVDPVVKMKYQMYEEGQSIELLSKMKSEQIKKKEDSEIEIKGIKGKLYPYQKVGVEFFINNNGKAILADTMGLGKTLQALAFVTTTGKEKTLIISPASVKYSWEEEVKKWTKLKPLVIESQTKLSVDEFTNHDVFIINYDILSRHGNALLSFRFDCLICDEFHYIKNNTAMRTKAVKAIAKRIPSLLLLSGTPMLSRPVELYNGLYLMNPSEWSNYWKYTIRYCGAHQSRWGWDVRGATNIKELQLRISRYFLRRTKEEVLKDLPPKQFTDIPVELPPEIRKEYQLALSDFQNYLKSVKNKSDKDITKTMQAEKLVRLAALRQITSRGKINHALNTINDIIDSGQKVVVFSVYNEPLEKLKQELGKRAVSLTGEVASDKRKEIIDKFQNDPTVQVFLGGTKSAGVGITLTSAANVLFIDYSWVPADHEQAADRIHRIGQKADSINIYQLYTKDTIDDYMCGLLAKKRLLFDKLIENNDSRTVDTNLTNDLIKMIEGR